MFKLRKCIATLATLSSMGLSGLAGAQSRTVVADISHPVGPHTQVPLRVVGAGRANEGLRADWQQQLATVQSEIGFQYIRMHGILHDDMGVYREDAKGNPEYNFQYVDALYDTLLKQHIRPFVELTFMPSQLASGSKTIFWWKGNITPPKDSAKWSALIHALVAHLKDRYGSDEIQKWYFEVWNEPDLHNLFFTGSLDDYLALYKNTAEAIKAECPGCRVGGPASAIPFAFETAFEKYVVANHVPADFVASHAYGVTKGFLDADGSAGTILDPAPDAVSGRMQHSRELLQHSGRPGMELHFTEWSSSYTPTDPMHDQYHEASFILDKIKRASPYVDSMSYWTFTDIFEENGPAFRPFHGGFGLLNLQGIRKPAYYAYRFLAQLGEQDVQSNDPQSWVTRSADGSVQALVWDYTPVVPPTGQTDQSFYRNELPAANKGTLHIELHHLPIGRYRISAYTVGYQRNDAYTAYLHMGAPHQLTRKQVELLQNASSGRAETVTEQEIKNGAYQCDLPLRTNDIWLIKLTPSHPHQ
ncbi:MAG: beta-xylosidase [Acidobacteriaceae bacterium]|nr:beta-xylosidase [Acidobacteriaceae bacterium]